MGLEEHDMEPLPLKANQAALGAGGFLGRQDLAHVWCGAAGFPAPLCFCLCKPWPGAARSHKLVGVPQPFLSWQSWCQKLWLLRL